MTIQLRQLCLVAERLAPVLEELTSILGINPCFVDPGVAQFGLENTLLSIGHNFLEVVAPVRPNTAASRYLEKRQGNGGYMVITQADTLANQRALRARALDNDVRIAHESERNGWHLCQLHPQDLRAAFLEVEYDPQEDFNGHWMPAGGSGWKSHVKQDVSVELLGVELQSTDPLAVAELWSRVIGVPLQRDGDHFCIHLNNADLRFVAAEDGRGDGLGGIDLAVVDRPHILAQASARQRYVNDYRIDICDTRFYLIDI